VLASVARPHAYPHGALLLTCDPLSPSKSALDNPLWISTRPSFLVGLEVGYNRHPPPPFRLIFPTAIICGGDEGPSFRIAHFSPPPEKERLRISFLPDVDCVVDKKGISSPPSCSSMS